MTGVISEDGENIAWQPQVFSERNSFPLKRLLRMVLPVIAILLTFGLQAARSDDACPTCKGTGKIVCPDCSGKGYISAGTVNGQPAAYGCMRCGGFRGDPINGPPGRSGTGSITCPTCGGKGRNLNGSPTNSSAAAKRQQELEEQKKKEEAEAKLKQEEFDQAKQEALKSMKGITENELGLKGQSSDAEFGLKGVDEPEKGDLGLKSLSETGSKNGRSALVLKEQADFDTMNSAWMGNQKKLISQRIANPNPWCSSIWRTLRLKEPLLPYKTLAELQPGDVLLAAPDEGISAEALKSRAVRFVDRLSSWEWKSKASHTLIFLKDVNGQKLFLDNQSGEGPRIKTEDEIVKEYKKRAMDVAQPAEFGIAQPLSKAEGDKLWAAARELGIKELAAEPKKAGNLIDKTNYGLYGDDNMVCSEISRWALIKAGRQIPGTGSPFKKLLGVYFGPANFYSQERYFLISPLGKPAKTRDNR